MSDGALRQQIHMAMLQKSQNAKECGELTVVPLGFAVTVAVEMLNAQLTAIQEDASVADKDPDAIHVSHFVHEVSCIPQLELWAADRQNAIWRELIERKKRI